MKRNHNAQLILSAWVLWMCAVWFAGCTIVSPTPSLPSATPNPSPKPTLMAVNTATTVSTIAATQPAAGAQTLLLATTVDLQTSGLLEYLLPKYTEQSGIAVQVTAAHGEQIFALGQAGKADVLLTASRAAEETALQQGDAIRREDIFWDDFVLLGPPTDPAGVKGFPNAADALQRIATQQAPFISTGLPGEVFDREQSLWILAQVTPQAPWYSTTQKDAMQTLALADQKQAYILIDRANYLDSQRTGLDLVIMVADETKLLNPYAALVVNPAKTSPARAEMANQFVDWLINVYAQEEIREYKQEERGENVFKPTSRLFQEHYNGSEFGQPERLLHLNGSVTWPQDWNEETLEMIPQEMIAFTDGNGVSQTEIGIPLTRLIEIAHPKEAAVSVTFVGVTGVTPTLSLAELAQCRTCMVAFREVGPYRLVMPGYAADWQMADLREIQVK